MGNIDAMGAVEDLRAIEQELDDICLEKERLENQLAELNKRLEDGRSYLMQVKPSELKVEDALESFGFGRNGLGS